MWDIQKRGFKGFLAIEKSLSDNSIEAYLRDIEKLLNQKLERIEIDGFEPEHLIPTKEKPQKKNFHNKAGFNNRKRNRKG